MSKSKTIRITLSIPEAYNEKFDEIKEQKSLSKSELLRRWIDEKYPDTSATPSNE